MRVAKVLIVTALGVSLISGCVSNSTAGTTEAQTTAKETSTELATPSSAEAIKLDGVPFNYGAVDMVRLAVQLGGNTTFDTNTSDLIGAKVTHTYSNNKLQYETIEIDSRDITTKIGDSVASLSMHVGKGVDDIIGEYKTYNRDLRAKVLAECLQLDSSKEAELINRGLADDFVSKSDRGIISVNPKTNAIDTYSMRETNELELDKDFITSLEFQSSISAYSKALQTPEAILTEGVDNWGDLLQAQLENYNLSTVTYTIRYAPNDKNNKSTDINDWFINNYDVDYKFENPTTKETWHFLLMSLNDNNIYKDPRSFSTGIYISENGITTKEELERIAKAVYGNQEFSDGGQYGGKEKYTHSADGLGYYHTVYREEQGLQAEFNSMK